MFSLIIVIVAVALVVSITVAMMYHGGDTINRGRVEASTAQAINEVGQIRAALTSFHANTGAHATSIADLKPDYLASIPDGWGIDLPNTLAFESSRLLSGTEAEKQTICEQVNTRLGVVGAPPNCAEIQAGFTGCCVVADAE